MNNRLLFALILLIGLYFPTSLAGNISSALLIAAFSTYSLLLALVWIRVGSFKDMVFCVAIPIPLWLLLCTFVSSGLLPEINTTPLAVYTVLGFLFCLKVKDLQATNLAGILAQASALNIAFGGAMILLDSAGSLAQSYYNSFTSELLSNMVAAHKPVTVFATHSLAGTFNYLLFFLNFRTYKKTGSRLFLWLGLLEACVCVALMSTTSLVFAALAFAELAWNFRKSAIAIVASILLFIPADIRGSILYAASLMLPNEGNGFWARYGLSGGLHPSIQFILDHPFRPIGLNYSPMLYIQDSGPMQYILLGSVPLLLLVYGGLFLFLARNLRDRIDLWRLFLLLLASEVGFSTITYFRSLLLIPASVIYLNSISVPHVQHSTAVKRFRAFIYAHIRQELSMSSTPRPDVDTNV